MVGRAASGREPIQIPDISQARVYAPRMREILGRFGFRASLAIPLLREERIVGALVVRRKSTGEFRPEVIDLMKTFATQSVLAIQNARLFREIEDKGRQIEAANRHKSEFLANMSHELRTPLNAIIGFSEVLLDPTLKVEEEEQRQFLTDVLGSGKHLLGLINEVLDLAKIEAGKMELQIEPALLQDVVEAVSNTMRSLAVKKSIDLRVDSDEGLASFPMDGARVKQVLLNLVGNAIKFTPEGERSGCGQAPRTDPCASRWAIPARVLRWKIRRGYFRSFSRPAVMRASLKALAWGWRWQKSSSRCTAAGSGSIAKSARAAGSFSRCRSDSSCPAKARRREV